MSQKPGRMITLPCREAVEDEFVIDNFMARRASLAAMVESPTSAGQLAWSIRVYPRGKSGQKGFGARLHLAAIPKGPKTGAIQCEVHLKDDSGETLKQISFANIPMEVGTERGINLAPNHHIPVAKSGRLIVRVRVVITRELSECFRPMTASEEAFLPRD